MGGFFCSQPIPGGCMAKTCDRTDTACLRFRNHLIFFPGIDADLIDLLLPRLCHFWGGGENVLYTQTPLCHPQMSQTISLGISGDLEYPGSKRLLAMRLISMEFLLFFQASPGCRRHLRSAACIAHIAFKAVHQFLNAP